MVHADFVVKFRVGSPATDKSPEEIAAWQQAGVEHQTALLEHTTGEFIRSIGGTFAVLAVEAA